MPLCPVPKAIRALLCLYKCAKGRACHHGSGELVLVPVVRKGAARILLDMRLVLVLGSTRDGLDRHCNGRIRRAYRDAPREAHLRGGEGRLLRDHRQPTAEPTLLVAHQIAGGSKRRGLAMLLGLLAYALFVRSARKS